MAYLSFSRSTEVFRLITREVDHPRDSITSIAYKERQTIVTITSPLMFQQHGFLADVFAVLGRNRVIVDMISTSEVSLSFSTEESLQLDLALHELTDLGKCVVVTGKTIIAIVAPDHKHFLRHEVDVFANEPD